VERTDKGDCRNRASSCSCASASSDSHTERGRAGLAANRREFCRLIWRLWSPNWAFDDPTFERTASSFDNPDFVDVTIQSYRHRFGNAPGDPALEPIEQRLAEIIRSFCADALSSTVNLNVDLDIMLCVLAQALLAAFRTRLGPGYATAAPDTLQRRFLDSSGTITINGDQVTVRIDRRAYSPALRQATLPPDTTVPWWHDRRLHFEFS